MMWYSNMAIVAMCRGAFFDVNQRLVGWTDSAYITHIWMFIIHLGQPQPEFSNHSLSPVGQVVDVKSI